MLHCPAGIERFLLAALNLFEIIHRICCINAEYFISYIYFVWLHFIQPDLFQAACFSPCLKWCCYINNWFSCLSTVSKEPWESYFEYFLHKSNSLKKKSLNKPYIIYMNPILYSSSTYQAECTVYFHVSNFW